MLKILQISDLHFGPFHWSGDDELLIEKINSYNVDLVIDTGDSTSDGLEREYFQAKTFLKKIECKNLVSIIGNHDKRSRSSVEFFKKYISNPDVIYPDNDEETRKRHLFLNSKMKLKERFTDINFIKRITIHGEKILIIGLDSNTLYSDDGFIEEAILNSISKTLSNDTYDLKLLLIHHSILATDGCPLINSQRVIDFVCYNKIDFVFCGHTHELDFREIKDIVNQHQFFQFMCGSTSSNDLGAYGKNVFILYEIENNKNFTIYLINIFYKNNHLTFKRERI